MPDDDKFREALVDAVAAAGYEACVAYDAFNGITRNDSGERHNVLHSSATHGKASWFDPCRAHAKRVLSGEFTVSLAPDAKPRLPDAWHLDVVLGPGTEEDRVRKLQLFDRVAFAMCAAVSVDQP